MSEALGTFANLCSILTAIVAVWLFTHVKCQSMARRRKIEEYLKSERQNGLNKGQRTILNIVARVGLTEQEVLQASFESKHISRLLKTNAEGYASGILLWYDEGAKGEK